MPEQIRVCAYVFALARTGQSAGDTITKKDSPPFEQISLCQTIPSQSTHFLLSGRGSLTPYLFCGFIFFFRQPLSRFGRETFFSFRSFSVPLPSSLSLLSSSPPSRVLRYGLGSGVLRPLWRRRQGEVEVEVRRGLVQSTRGTTRRGESYATPGYATLSSDIFPLFKYESETHKI